MKNTILLGILLFSFSTAFPQTYKFLNLDTSPRAAALAGGFVSANDDPNVIFYNPAGINLLEGIPVSFSFVNHLMDINSASLSAVKEYDFGKLGAAVKYVSYGDFTRATSTGEKTGNFGASDIAFILGYGNKLDENFYYGINTKFIYSSIDEYSSSALAVDLGLHYEFSESMWNIGFSVLNIGSQLSTYAEIDEDLPLDVRVGVSKQLKNVPFRFYFSLNKLNENQESIADRLRNFTLGAEIKLGPSFILRFGYDSEKRKELKIGSSAGLAGFNLGFGFNVKNFTLDYGFSSMGFIGSIHRFGISTNLE
ncbi:type IX secretion system protein PorQ [Melioribacter sp. Ez-97]|uniref:type IX secretion system protein PorQ n=1 Tax=Melioribacter sp. Ez-97 TaxID=3423434 RepID=UPI003EDA3C40